MKKKAIRKNTLKLNNSLEIGTVYYGLHMSEGLAHYKPPGEEEFTVFVGNDTIKLMNSSFAGKPVYVGHVDEHTPLAEADGVVSESFYNPYDGKHWCKFIVTTQKGLDALNNGWVLSNSLLVKKHSSGGEWHGLNFDRTVDQGTFHHLAIVNNPRYAESIVLTPEEYKHYNNSKKAELEMLQNSKENTSMFKLFKNEAQDDKKSKELLGMSVVLPKTKRSVTFEQLCNEADVEKPAEAAEEKFDLDGAMVSFKELMKLYKDLKAQFDELEIIEVADESEQLSNSSEESEEESEDEDLDESGDLDEEESEELDEEDLDALDAADEAAEQKKLDNAKSDKKKAVKKEVKKGSVAKKLKNASEKANSKFGNQGTVVDLTSDQIKRGADRYGSKKK